MTKKILQPDQCFINNKSGCLFKNIYTTIVYLLIHASKADKYCVYSFLGELKGMIKILKRDGKVVKIGVKG